jgi:hypothetical protein
VPGRSSATLEARLPSRRTQLCAVAIFYALLAIWSFRREALLVSLVPWSNRHELISAVASSLLCRTSPDPLFASALRIYVSFGAVCAALATLSLRYLALKPKWRALTLVGSGLFALAAFYVIGRMTLNDPVRLASDLPGALALWGAALACALCFFILWQHRRASNNRWRGP